MSVSINTAENDGEITIAVIGRFDFTQHAEFRQAFERLPEGTARCTVDLQGTDYLDSAALGMLLLLRDRVGAGTGTVVVRNCNPAVREILHIASFDSLFAVE